LNTSNALMSQCPAKSCIFKSCLKRSYSTAGSHSEPGSEFQTVGPVTENARVPKVLRRNREYSVRDGWLNGDVGGLKLRRLACSC